MAYEIRKLYKELCSLRPLPETVLAKLNEEYITRNTYNSNAIEGNTLTLNETFLVVQQGLTIAQKPLKDHLEAVGHRDALKYVLRVADEKKTISETELLHIHSLVLADNAEERGTFRAVEVRISGVEYMPPPAEAVPAMVRRLLEKNAVNGNDEIVARVGRFHLEFESIHPFADGNGRTGRLLLNLELLRRGYPPIDIKFSDRTRYYYALQSWQGPHGEDAPMLQMIKEYLAAELRTRIHLAWQAMGRAER